MHYNQFLTSDDALQKDMRRRDAKRETMRWFLKACYSLLLKVLEITGFFLTSTTKKKV